MNRISIFIVGFLFFGYVHATCYYPDGKRYYPRFSALEGLSTLPDSEQIKFANEFLKETKHWRSYIPNLSPSEETWLNSELKAGVKRQLSAMRSKEYMIRNVASYLEQNASILEEITSSKNISSKRNIFLWSVLSSNLSSSDFVKDSVNLHDSYGVLKPSTFRVADGSSALPWISDACMDSSQAIQRAIVIPYLRGEG